MDKSSILSEFDTLVRSRVALYDDHQRRVEYVDGGLEFTFLLTSALANKPSLQTPRLQDKQDVEPKRQLRAGSDIDTREFEIGDVGDTHFVAVNKFCFARPHLMLLTTDGGRKQYEPLDHNDMEAAWSLLDIVGSDYISFYNCGKDGGCSRLHKHMQVMPKPAKSFAAFLDTDDSSGPDVPFQWFHHRFEPRHTTPAHLTKVYVDLLRQATKARARWCDSANDTPDGAACPHNVILTRQWMIVVPRRRAAINEKAGVSALGMLGLIAVATEDEIDDWVRRGPTEALRELGVPNQ